MISGSIKVLIVDDHPVTRQGIRVCLEMYDNILVVGEAATGREAIAQAQKLHPQIVLMDINMPEMNGLEATNILKQELPAIKVIAFSVNVDKAYILGIVRAGAVGYLLKDCHPNQLIEAINQVYLGKTYFPSHTAQVLVDDYLSNLPTHRPLENQTLDVPSHSLTERQKEILMWIAQGLSSQEIADYLHISFHTVKSHRNAIMKKLNIHNTLGLIKYAVAHKLVHLD